MRPNCPMTTPACLRWRRTATTSLRLERPGSAGARASRADAARRTGRPDAMGTSRHLARSRTRRVPAGRVLAGGRRSGERLRHADAATPSCARTAPRRWRCSSRPRCSVSAARAMGDREAAAAARAPRGKRSRRCPPATRPGVAARSTSCPDLRSSRRAPALTTSCRCDDPTPHSSLNRNRIFAGVLLRAHRDPHLPGLQRARLARRPRHPRPRQQARLARDALLSGARSLR